MPNKITKDTKLEELAVIVFEHLKKNEILAVLSGGSVVSIYTDNKYESYDLDFISPEDHNRITEVMAEIGYVRRSPTNRYLDHDACPITIEFPTGPVNFGGIYEPYEKIKAVDLPAGKIRMLSPTQSVMDRLSLYLSNSKDPQGLDQAEWICERQAVNYEKIREWAQKAGASKEEYERICSRCERGMKKRLAKPANR